LRGCFSCVSPSRWRRRAALRFFTDAREYLEVAPACRVYLEVGKQWVFAGAVDWPGWCRRGKGEQAAIAALQDYESRYRIVAGSRFKPGEVQIVARLTGNATTDFGAPGAPGPFDADPLVGTEAVRQTDLLHGCWRGFDEAVAGAPARLPKGPRGGGRDRDQIVDHVREAERAYARKLDLRIRSHTPWDEQRGAISDALRGDTDDDRGGTPTAWTPRYVLRRIAWHVLDHAWELEDKSRPDPP
jgi:hypothetical protein